MNAKLRYNLYRLFIDSPALQNDVMWNNHALSMHASLRPWKLAETVTTYVCESFAQDFIFIYITIIA